MRFWSLSGAPTVPSAAQILGGDESWIVVRNHGEPLYVWANYQYPPVGWCTFDYIGRYAALVGQLAGDDDWSPLHWGSFDRPEIQDAATLAVGLHGGREIVAVGKDSGRVVVVDFPDQDSAPIIDLEFGARIDHLLIEDPYVIVTTAKGLTVLKLPDPPASAVPAAAVAKRPAAKRQKP